MRGEPDPSRLRESVESALKRAIDPSAVLPLLHKLARTAAQGSEESLFAHEQLAELLVERDPWRASVFARRVIAHRRGDDRAWAVLALAQTLLGHYRYAATAYERAIAAAPENPWYAHNLGHLLDVALGRPREALSWLEAAHSACAKSSDIAASYAHALARAGQVEDAKRVLVSVMKLPGAREHAPLWEWLEQGAPPDRTAPRTPRRTPTRGGAKRGRIVEPKGADYERMIEKLARGLTHLPLDKKQRARARAIARDLVARRDDHPTPPRLDPSPEQGAESIAAAIAYAIVYVDHLPLSPADVAAPFRVGVARLRGTFAALRAELDLTRGDARYASRP